MITDNLEFRTEALNRLATVSDSALREMCELVDDLMVIGHKHDELEIANTAMQILIDLVMEEERRSSCVQSCSSPSSQ